MILKKRRFGPLFLLFAPPKGTGPFKENIQTPNRMMDLPYKN
jgi:hypothetical protein